MIYGLRAIIEAIKANEQIDKLYLQRGSSGNLQKELEMVAKKNKIPISYVPVEKLNKLSDQNHQGAVAIISPVEILELEPFAETILAKKENPIFLLLDQLSDVRNFGAIIRTAECAGVSGIIIQKKGSAAINSDTIKTSAGAIFNVPICKVDHIKDAVYYLQSSGVRIIAATEKTEKSIYDLAFQGNIAIIMGSEDRGINPSVLKIVDEKGKLPILGKIDSLNVSVACGAILYEVVRQRL